MEYADFIKRLPSLQTAFSEEDVTIRAIASADGLVAFFEFHKDVILPSHSHLGQWGTVLEGDLELTIGGDTHTYRRGETYDIPSGVVHSAKIKAGTKVIDVFEEGDRYPLKR